MKVAVFEPFPRMCGVTKWTFEVVHGFRSLGHEAHVVSASKSGRTRVTEKKRKFDGSLGNGWQWWPQAPDVQLKWADAVDALAEYDLVVLNEPKNATCDRAVKRSDDLPEYVQTFVDLKTPWTTILHAPQYEQRLAPYLDRIFESRLFTGFAIEHQPGSFDSGRWAMEGRVKARWPWPWLPYRRRFGTADYPTVHRLWAISLAGRFVQNKGGHTLAWLADRFPEYCAVRLYGTEPGGLGPANSYDLYASLVESAGWRGTRTGRAPEPDEIGNYGDKSHCWPWKLSKTEPDGKQHVLEYVGGYDDPLSIWAQSAIAVNLTARQFAVGLEYTSLEAMDAGCAIVLPEYSLAQTGSEQYETHATRAFDAPSSIDKLLRSHDNDDDSLAVQLRDVVETIHQAHDAIRYGDHNPAVNRAAIDAYHDPKHVAREILKGVE